MRTTKELPTKNSPFIFVKHLNKMLFLGLFLTQITFGQTIGTEKSCVDCHKRTVKKDILHGPVAADCKSCHLPNGKEHPIEDVEGFTILAEGEKLCFSCHKEEEAVILNNKYVHKPLTRGECLECHEVHSSNDSKLIFTKSPDLCYFCHSKVEKAVGKSAVVHSPVIKEDGCIGCHSPHSSNNRKILVSNQKTLCLSCHDKPLTKETREIANINKHLNENEFIHPPVEDGCSSCHRPHASDNNSLLKIAYPQGNYAPGTEDNYELCFACHDTDLLLAERTKYGTEFRNGDLNLHYVHVNMEKGRTCRNCHDVHAGPNIHLIPETVKFGSWDMPLKFRVIENGGTCNSGCHKELQYVRN